VLCKGLSPIRPFAKVTSPRKFLLYLGSADEKQVIFLKSLKFMRPGDSIVVMSIAESREPRGDCRDTRYSFGRKAGYWVNGPTGPVNEPDCVGWNDKQVEELSALLDELVKNSFLEGTVRIETQSPTISDGKIICNVAFSVNADAIVIGSKNNRDSVIECVHESHCAVVLVK
jgi:nucleotide-binding universal stress UspA family protein